jgi:branched-subunit amino acid aminotransferase/4-amino-4-deoxychorismate lyase
MAQWAYLRGEFVPLAEANVNILTNSFQYGVSAFEGIRATGTMRRSRHICSEPRNTMSVCTIIAEY